MPQERLRTTLLVIGVVLLFVIALAVTYPYHRAWRAREAAATAVEQERTRTAAVAKTLRSITAPSSVPWDLASWCGPLLLPTTLSSLFESRMELIRLWSTRRDA
jgi:membrane-associated PAP2 superfamily phosphatase